MTDLVLTGKALDRLHKPLANDYKRFGPYAAHVLHIALRDILVKNGKASPMALDEKEEVVERGELLKIQGRIDNKNKLIAKAWCFRVWCGNSPIVRHENIREVKGISMKFIVNPVMYPIPAVVEALDAMAYNWAYDELPPRYGTLAKKQRISTMLQNFFFLRHPIPMVN